MKNNFYKVMILLLVFSGLTNLNAQDTIPPTPYCINISTALLENGMVELWAIDFNVGSFDDTTDDDLLRFSFSDTDPEQDPLYDPINRSTSRVFVGPPHTEEVDMYVWDLAGNYDFCTVSLTLIDNNGNNNQVNMNAEGVEGVIYTIESENGYSNSTTNNYFNNLYNGVYSVSATSNFAPLDGVSTLDLLLIQRHILKIVEFDVTDKYFAADVSGDSKINILDLLQMRKVILGQFNNFPIGKSWVFGDEEQVFNADLDLVLSEGLDTEIDFVVDNENVNVNFNAIKLGDINGVTNLTNDEDEINSTSLIDRGGRINQSLNIRTNPEPVEFDFILSDITDTDVCFTVNVSEFNEVAGFQFPVVYDEALLELTSVESQLGNSIAFNTSNDGFIYVLGSDAGGGTITLADGTALIEFCFEILESSTPIDLSFDDDSFEASVFSFLDECESIFNDLTYVIEEGCLTSYTADIEPFSGVVTVFANDLYIGEEANDVLTVNGLNAITFECDDIGLTEVMLSIEFEDGTVEECTVNIEVVDNIPPVAVSDGTITVMLNDDLEYTLTAAQVDDGSYDQCGDVILSLDVYTLDCSSPNPSLVELTVVDESGNYNTVMTEVNIVYPVPPEENMACNDFVQMSVPSNGTSYEVTADMLLEGVYSTCYSFFEVQLFDDGSNVPQDDNFVDISDAGNTYQYMVTNPDNGNSCWGNISIESFGGLPSIIVPSINVGEGESICIPITVLDFVNIAGAQFSLAWDTDVITFGDVLLNQNIDFDMDYNIVDNQHINFLMTSSDLDDMSLVNNTVLFELCFEITGNDGDFSALSFEGGLEEEMVNISGDVEGIYSPGYITIGESGICYTNLFVSLGISTTILYGVDCVESDPNIAQVLINGSESIELDCDDLGSMTAEIHVEYNDGSTTDCLVLLTIEDKLSPSIVLNSNGDVEIDLTSNSVVVLTSDMLVDSYYDNCDVTFTFSPAAVDCSLQSPVSIIVTGTDNSGNSAEATMTVELIYPVSNGAITCNSDVVISIYEGLETEITPDMILEGNTNCYGVYELEIFDNVDAPAPQDDNIIDISDAGNTYLVVVTNENGNSCWSNLTIEEIDCGEDFFICDTESNCAPIGDCDSGHSLTDGVEWPCDISINSCVGQSFSPSELEALGIPAKDVAPVLDFNDCDLIGYAWADDIFANEFIARTWTVVDWNQYDPTTNEGIWTYVQTITLNEIQYDENNYIEVCDTKSWDNPVGDCESGHTLSDAIEWPRVNVNINYATNDPSIFAPEFLINYGVDFRDAQPILSNGVCSYIYKTYEDQYLSLGDDNWKIIRNWTVINWYSGNVYEWIQIIKNYENSLICDTQAWNTPLGDCDSGHTLSDDVEWPSDITVNTDVNYNPFVSPSQLEINPDVNANDVRPRLFNNVNNYVLTYNDEIVVLSGQQDSVERSWYLLSWFNNETYTYVQSITVNGTISNTSFCAINMFGHVLPGVNMHDNNTTGDNGCVEMDLDNGTVVSPSKEDDWTVEVDVFDLLLIYKAILNQETLSPYQLIAADMDQNGVLNIEDAVLLESILDGDYINDESPWVFVDVKHDFGTDYNIYNVPTDFPQSIAYDSGEMPNAFVGIKRGDVNGTYDPLFLSSQSGESSLVAKDILLNKGETYKVNLTLDTDHLLESMQFELAYNLANLEIYKIESDILPDMVMDQNISISNGQINIIYGSTLDQVINGQIELSANEIIFEIEFLAKENGILSEELTLNDAFANRLIDEETNAFEYVKLDLVYEDQIINNNEKLFKNGVIEIYPQPANSFVMIDGLNDDFKGKTYSISNLTGQQVQYGILASKQLDITAIYTGVYFIKIYQDEVLISTNKLMVNK